MSSSASVDVMRASGTAAASEEGGYVQLEVPTPAAEKSSRVLVGATITAFTLLIATILSLPAYLLLRSSESSDSPLLSPQHVSAPGNSSSNSSQYGNYPMLYEDPRNQWKPADGFLFNMTSVDIDLNKVPLSQYRGNITLVTNVASF